LDKTLSLLHPEYSPNYLNLHSNPLGSYIDIPYWADMYTFPKGTCHNRSSIPLELYTAKRGIPIADDGPQSVPHRNIGIEAAYLLLENLQDSHSTTLYTLERGLGWM
jgi:hypothetical protein